MAVGLVASSLFPALQGGRALTDGLWQSVLGIAAGAGIIYAICGWGNCCSGGSG